MKRAVVCDGETMRQMASEASPANDVSVGRRRRRSSSI